MPLSWGVSQQTCTASSTAEAETVAFSHALRREAMPLQMLLEAILAQHVRIICRVDNTQTIAAVRKGYSPSLRHLARLQRASLGQVHDFVTEPPPEGCGHVVLLHRGTDEHKRDIFTKALSLTPYDAAVKRLGERPAILPVPSKESKAPAKRKASLVGDAARAAGAVAEASPSGGLVG